MSHQDSADLEWFAFQYVSDELPAAEAARFEDRLAGDQAAREAVAESMLLLQAVAAGARIASPAPHRTWLQPAAWAAIGAAACLAIIFAIRSLPRDPVVAQRPQAADLTSAELALVWAQNSSFEDPSSAEVAAEEDLSLAADADVIVPVWMLEALSGSEEAKPPIKESQES